MKLSTFIIAVMTGSLFMVILGLAIADLNSKSPVSSYSSSDIAAFDKLNDSYNLSNSIKDRVMNQSTNRNLLDVVGGMLANGMDTVRLAVNSFDIFFSMTSSGFDKLNLPGQFVTTIIAMVVIILFLGVIVSALIGREV